MNKLYNIFIYLLFITTTLFANSQIVPMQEESNQTVDILLDNQNSTKQINQENVKVKEDSTNIIENDNSLDNQKTELQPPQAILDITIDNLKTYPKGELRNFYIWKFLQQDITSIEAQESLELIENMDINLFEKYAKKINHDETYAIIECRNANAQSLVNQSADCISLGLIPNKIILLDFMQKQQVIDKIDSKYSTQSQIINILNSSLPFTKLVSAKPEVFFGLFNNINISYIKSYFNYKISPSILDKLSQFSEFNKTVEIIVTSNELSTLQESFLREFNYQSLNNNSLFYLGLNALRFDNTTLAQEFLETLKKRVKSQSELDKINYWLYSATSNQKFLQEIQDSDDLNIYSIFVKESNQNLQTPILTSQILDAYPTLYDEFLKNESKENQALIYAISKSKTNLNPDFISKGFNIGFLGLKTTQIEEISKKLNNERALELTAQFEPKNSIEYALFKIKVLEKSSKYIPFLIYGYVKSEELAKNIVNLKIKEKYEPFLNIELSTKFETSEYLKSILLNYYFYINKLDSENPTKISTLFLQILTDSSQSPNSPTSALNRKK